MLGIAQRELARQWTGTAGTSPITKLVQWLYQLTCLLIMFPVLFWHIHILVQLKMSNSAFPCTHHHIIRNRNNTRIFEAPFLRPSPDIPAPNARCQSCVSVPTLASAPLTLHTQRFQAAPSVCQPLSTLFHSRVFYSIAVPPSSSRLLSWLSLSLYQFLSAQGNCADVLLVVGWIGQDQWFSMGSDFDPQGYLSGNSFGCL